MINIMINSLEATIFIMAVFTFFGVSIFVLFKYLAHDKQIKEQVDKVLIEYAKYIKQEFDKHFDKTKELTGQTIEELNNFENRYIKNLTTIAKEILNATDELKKLEDKIALRDNEIINLQNKIKEKDGIIARKTKQIQRLKDEI